MKALAVLFAAVALAGCAEGVDEMALTSGSGGAGGSAPVAMGTGGASQASSTDPITASDATTCDDWPECPPTVFFFQGGNFNTQVTLSPTCAHRFCGACADMASACSAFIGRCKAHRYTIPAGSRSLCVSAADFSMQAIWPDFVYCTQGNDHNEPVTVCGH